MPALPTVGGSNNTWGTELNDFLGVAHNTDGTVKAPLALVGDVSINSGEVVIGTSAITTAGTVLEVWNADADADPAIVLGRTSGTARSISIQWRTGGATNAGSKLFMAASAGAFLTGTAIGDTGIKVVTTAKTFHIGGSTKIVSVTADNTLGFFAATPVAKPTVTGSRGGNAALADLLTELATLGLITDSSSA